MFGNASKPKNRSFEEIFYEHVSLSKECAAKLMQLFLSMDNIPARIREIVELEHEGDRLNHEIYRALDSSFMTRIEKPDIQDLVHQLDDILDGMQEAAYLIEVYEIKRIRKEAVEIVAVIQDMLLVLKEKIQLMTTRKGLSMLSSQEGHARLDVLETKADELWRKGVKSSFRESDAKEFFAFKEMFDALEEVTDRCLKAMSDIDSIVRKDSH